MLSASSVAWCGDAVSRGGMYKFATMKCLMFLFVWILTNCGSLLCVLMSKWVNVMLCLMYVFFLTSLLCLCVWECSLLFWVFF